MPLPVIRPEKFEVTMAAKRVLGTNTEEYVFALPAGRMMPAHAGQFVMVEVPVESGPPPRRPYSVVHGQEPGSSGLDHVTLCVKVLPGGVSSGMMHRTPVGGTITILGPFGHFGLVPFDAVGGQRILVATGTGIAPYIGMLTEHFRDPAAAPITLLTGDRTEAEILYADEVAAFGDRLTVIRCISQPTGPWGDAPGQVKGRLTSVLPSLLTAPATTQVYLCGNPSMIEEVSAMCVAAGIPPAQLIVEKFTSIGKVMAARAGGAATTGGAAT